MYPNWTGYVQKNTTSISGTVGRVEKKRSRSHTPGARGSTSKRIPLRSAGPSDESKKSVRAPPAPGPGGLRPQEDHLDQRDRRASRKRAFAHPHPRGPGVYGDLIRVTNPNENPNGTGQVRKDTTSISGTVGRVE
ncbi:hypothetical protein DPMN_131370 [Dreissena polymorpha]|uniref:Uncharacterized protein n=1 Tax=Dreissena polymorpha TaxID=45954 RepID=A0A9D4H4H9_DREPO|nr:hypothetical protein DPMN_131370 [Dreissena polymorpha]